MKGEIELYNISFLILKVELHFNRITLISVYVADHNCCMIVYTQLSKTHR